MVTVSRSPSSGPTAGPAASTSKPRQVPSPTAPRRATINADAAEPLAVGANKHTPSDDVDTTVWLTRVDVCDMLHCGAHKLLYLEKTGYLHPRRAQRIDAAGAMRVMTVYDPREVAKVPRRSTVGAFKQPDGELAARAFELFDSGFTDRQIVVELRETPDKIIELREKWFNAGGSDLVMTPEIKRLLEDKIGPFETVGELVERVGAAKAREPDLEPESDAPADANKE